VSAGHRPIPPDLTSLRPTSVGVRREAEIGERTIAVDVEDQPCDLVVAYVEYVRGMRSDLPQVQTAGLSTAAETN
jgi:hypothetical protein